MTDSNAITAQDSHLTIDPDEVEILSPREAATSRFIERMLELHEEGRQALHALLNEPEPTARYRLYRKLRQINDAVGIPTDSMEVLGVQPPAQAGNAA